MLANWLLRLLLLNLGFLIRVTISLTISTALHLCKVRNSPPMVAV